MSIQFLLALSAILIIILAVLLMVLAISPSKEEPRRIKDPEIEISKIKQQISEDADDEDE